MCGACVRVCVCGAANQTRFATPPPPTKKPTITRKKKAESEYTHWSLLSRFVLANEVLDAVHAAGPAGMAFVLTWLRLSSAKLLDWSRRSNYQSKVCVRARARARSLAPMFSCRARHSAGGCPLPNNNAFCCQTPTLSEIRSP